MQRILHLISLSPLPTHQDKGEEIARGYLVRYQKTNKQRRRIMQVTIKRTFKGPEYTIGKLYIDGAYFCDTLEDTVRPDGVKIYGKTAIPAGDYKVKKTWSPRFKKKLPEILDVKNFSGVRIHNGTTNKDTCGCVLLGLNKVKGAVLCSQNTMAFFMDRTPDEFDLTIE